MKKEKQVNGKNILEMRLILSKVDKQLYCALDGNPIDMAEFGILPESYWGIVKKILEIFKSEIIEKP